jgi:hypothetical protein
MQDDGVGSGQVVAFQKQSIPSSNRNESGEKAKRRSPKTSPFPRFAGLERLNIFSLPALGTLGHFELHALAFLQALKTA